jgi:guanylate kinase
MPQGKLIIFSAPSGSGKTTIVHHLLKVMPELGFSISACTRDRRGRNEQNGKDYYFMSPEEFKVKIDDGAFAEWQEVYPGALYGTLKSEIQRLWDNGLHVIFDVDVKGGINLKKLYGDRALSVFVRVSSMEELEKRLRYRQTETEDQISGRLFKVKFEMSFQDQFDVVLINDDLEVALKEAEQLVRNFIER